VELNYFELWSRSVNEEPARYAAGQTIFSKDDSGVHMYIVRSGEVAIKIDERVVEIVKTNGIFGEMALIDGGSRSAAAIAQTDCELAPIDQRTFLLMVDEAPYFAVNVMRLMASRLRRKSV
jgi:CRP/FNR family cyclic AMP-dependent transcriptional regulator